MHSSWHPWLSQRGNKCHVALLHTVRSELSGIGEKKAKLKASAKAAEDAMDAAEESLKADVAAPKTALPCNSRSLSSLHLLANLNCYCADHLPHVPWPVSCDVVYI